MPKEIIQKPKLDKEKKTCQLVIWMTPTQLDNLETKYKETINQGEYMSLPNFVRQLLDKACQ